MSKPLLTFIRTHDGRITATTRKMAYAISPDHPEYTAICAVLADGAAAIDVGDRAAQQAAADRLDQLADVPAALSAITGGKVTVENGRVLYEGRPCHHQVAKVIIERKRAGVATGPLMKFLERLMHNPSYRSVENIYTFCEKFGLTIDEDGYILAFKRVRQDWMDCYRGKVDNSIGTVVEMPRHAVSDDPRVPCSEGFHFGSKKFVAGFSSDGRVIVIRIDPADVVLVPYDLGQEKARCCKYTVLREHGRDLAEEGGGFQHPVYAAGLDEPYQG